jgi:hypothetical protein
MAKVAQIKTKETTANVEGFLNKITDEQRRKDSFAVLTMMKKASGEAPKMWGSSIIGFGNKRFKSPTSGREVDWFLIGFSPRKTNLTLYLLNMQNHAASLKKLGKHKIGGGCLYINKLDDVDSKVLQLMINDALKANK